MDMNGRLLGYLLNGIHAGCSLTTGELEREHSHSDTLRQCNLPSRTIKFMVALDTFWVFVNVWKTVRRTSGAS
jgi:hypothetical protein